MGAPANLKQPGRLLWALIEGIRSAVDLHAWLDLVESADANDLRPAFGERLAATACRIALNMIWIREHERPAFERDWVAVADVLTRA